MTSSDALVFSGRILGGETLEFEGKRVAFDPEGEFSHEFILVEGMHQYLIDAQFNNGEERQYQLQILLDNKPPEISIDQPSGNFVTDIEVILVQGHVSDDTSVSLLVDGLSVDVNQNGEFQSMTSLSLGENQILIEAIDELGYQSSKLLQGSYDPDAFVAPNTPNKLLISLSHPTNGVASVEGFPGAVDSTSDVRIVNPAQLDETLAVSDVAGSFSGDVLASVGQSIFIHVVGSNGVESDPINLVVPEIPPPFPQTVAPELPATPITHFADAVEFLYAGDPPIQMALEPALLDRNRVAVVQGMVRDDAGVTLPGVLVKAVNGPTDYGYTISREDGRYDMVVNGGPAIVLEYSRQGFLSVQRTVETEWQSYSQVAPVDLVPYDSQSTLIAADSTELQVARGSVQVDASGARQATLFFHPGTGAQAAFSDGTSRMLEELTVRATEYTVGSNGPNRMPASLPLTTAYTYALELSVDEAVLQGATRVDFNQSVSLYVENFLGFPVGSPVPVGYYDYSFSSWLPSENGRIVEIVGQLADTALIDIDGDGVAEDVIDLLDLGITADEAIKLMDLYDVGDQLWRTSITHFTPWDCNWPYGPPDDSEDPEFDGPDWGNPDNPPGEGDGGPNGPESGDDHDEQPECESGSIIECENRVLRESLPIFGSSHTLNYRSDRVPGFSVNAADLRAAKMRIPLTGGDIPDSLKAVRARVYANGALVDSFLDEDPQPSMVWENAGMTAADYFSRPPGGRQRIEVELSHGYEPVFYESPSAFEASFGVSRGVREFSADRRSNIIWRTKRWSASSDNVASGSLAIPNPPNLKNNGLAGWTISPHHTYDQYGGVLWRGDGVRREVPSSLAISPIVRPEEESIQSAAIAPDGSVYWLSTTWSEGGQYGGGELTSILYRTSPEGDRTVVSTSISCSDMGLSQNSAKCSGETPLSEGAWTPANTVLIDGRGQLFVALRDLYANSEIVQRLYRIAANGAAYGLYTFREGSMWQIPSRFKNTVEAAREPKSRADEPLGCGLIGIDAKDGRVYFACSEYGGQQDYPSIGMVWANGSVSHIAGGTVDVGSQSQPAIDAAIERPRGLAVADDGSVFFSTYNQIWRITKSGVLELYAGSGVLGDFEERQPRFDASFGEITALAFAPDNSLYVLDSGYDRVRMIDQNDLVRTVAGGGGLALDQIDEKVPAQSIFDLPWSSDAITFGSDGALYLTEQTYYGTAGAAVFRIGRDAPQKSASRNEIEVVSSDGTELYIFDDGGRHLRTFDVLTGSIVYEFEYDNDSRLSAIVNAYGRNYSIERTGSSINVRTPFDVETSLSINQDGYLDSLRSPEGRQWTLEYGAGGLMTESVDPSGNSTTYVYGLQSKLVSHSLGGQVDWTLSEYRSANGSRNVQKTSGVGDQTVYSRYLRGNQAGFGGIEKTWYPDGSSQTNESRPEHPARFVNSIS